MKIAYLTSRYPAVSHTFIQREIAALRAAGHEIQPISVRRVTLDDLLTEEDRGEFAVTAWLLPASVFRVLGGLLRVGLRHPLGCLRGLWCAWRERPAGLKAGIWSLFYWVEAILLADLLRERGITHVHVHFANVAGAVAQIASVIIGGSWSLTIHGLSDFGDPSANALARRLRNARFVVCVSRFGQAQAMLHMPTDAWSKLHVVYCGIDPDRFPPREAAPREGQLKLLSVARLSREKGHAVLLDALAILKERGVNCTCTMIGDGPLRASLEERTRENGLQEMVRWEGAVGQDQIQSYYEAADAFVLPSLAEGLPVVLMEALAKGVPCVASGMMGIPELIEHRRAGLLVPPGDARALADALAEMLIDAQLRKDTAAAGRNRVLETFDIRKNVRQLVELFERSAG